MNWRETSNAILAKIAKYAQDKDGWKTSKKTKDVTVWWKPSPDWNGTLYKGESVMYSDPETVFSYIDPTPNGPRSRWDRAIKELQTVDTVEKDLTVVRTITHSAFGGLISSRDFVDLVVNVCDDKAISTNAQGVEYPGCKASADHIRGVNHPCAIICHRVQGEPDKTIVTSYIQTDLGGLLPKALVENALPSNQVDFFESLKKVLKDDGHWKGPKEEEE